MNCLTHYRECNVYKGTASPCNCSELNHLYYISNTTSSHARTFNTDKEEDLKKEIADLKRRNGQLQQELLSLRNRRHK